MNQCKFVSFVARQNSWPVQRMNPKWPDSTTFWPNKRVVVTGGQGTQINAD